MDQLNMLTILSQILGVNQEPKNRMPIEEVIDDLIEGEVIFHYFVEENEKIRVEKCYSNGKKDITYKSLREIIWRKCRLQVVCAKYKEQYEIWKNDNGDGIPYMETKVINDATGDAKGAFRFIKDFWEKNVGAEELPYEGHLRLLLAEYGMGKSSFCYGIRELISQEIKKRFLEEDAPFPFIFDLNEYRSSDFDKFVETELWRNYRISMDYKTFEMLCQNGYFMVVLDAWDQMKSARQSRTVKRDLGQMKSLWENRGCALITCRRSFYQQQLKLKDTLSQNVGLYTLLGFDKACAIEYLKCAKEKSTKFASQMEDEENWINSCWKLNEELIGKPLNLKLLVKHFEALTDKVNIRTEKVVTYKFLKIVFEDWKKETKVEDDTFLKLLVSQTLYSGLNRGISFSRFEASLAESTKEKAIFSLQKFDFVKINEHEDRIEFCLAAYQEFLWAYFVLKELEENKSEEHYLETELLSSYILIREVREWICTVLGDNEFVNSTPKFLTQQFTIARYKRIEDVGYRAANALTLLCDLNRISYYRNQLDEVKKNLHHLPLCGADVHGMNLSDADFHMSNLSYADFSYTRLDNVDFSGAILEDVIWDEHNVIKKCAFLKKGDSLCVAAGTKNGGVLTYRIDDGVNDVVGLQTDIINDLAGDRGGIYTASADGWVGYIDENGDLKNAFISQSGLQSIVHTGNGNSVYVGADNQGIYRFNWHTGSKYQIEIQPGPLDGVQEGRISDIHYYSRNNDNYIVYTLGNKKLIWLRLFDNAKGEVNAWGTINSDGYQFGDICFAGDWLIYSVLGKGIFRWPMDEAIGEITEDELLDENRCLLREDDAHIFYLSWAEKNGEIMVVTKKEDAPVEKIYSINLSGKIQELAVDWIFRTQNYAKDSSNMKGFCVSEDGLYVAFSGSSLAVFKRDENLFELLNLPIRAKISCQNAIFSGCSGMYPKLERFLTERGARLGGAEV